MLYPIVKRLKNVKAHNNYVSPKPLWKLQALCSRSHELRSNSDQTEKSTLINTVYLKYLTVGIYRK